MIPALALFAAASTLVINPGFEDGLNGWRVKGEVRVETGQPISGKASLVVGPGNGSVEQRYDVPGLRILLFTAKMSGREGRIRLRCFDRRGRVVMEQTAEPDDKGSAGIYLKTQARTAYVTLGVEKEGAGIVRADDVALQDDDRDRVEHAPLIDLDEAMDPIWHGQNATDESVLLFDDGTGPASGRLLFAPNRVLTVRDPARQGTYVEGQDYAVEGDRIVRLPGSRMPRVAATELPKGDYPWFDLAGKHVFVTYTHDDAWKGPTPQFEGDNLPHTMALLRGRKPLTIVALGDSITLGINVSGFRNVPPYQPPWPSLAADRLGKIYDDSKVTLYNVGLGGMTAQWGAGNSKDAVAALDPDLVIVAFGMNDFWSVEPEAFRQSIEAILAAVRARRPKAEFILVGSMRFDPAYTKDPLYIGHFDGYVREMRKLVGPGVRLFDMAALSTALYEKKGQKSLGTDPMHPDDYLARWYAQGIVAMFDPREQRP